MDTAKNWFSRLWKRIRRDLVQLLTTTRFGGGIDHINRTHAFYSKQFLEASAITRIVYTQWPTWLWSRIGWTLDSGVNEKKAAHIFWSEVAKLFSVGELLEKRNTRWSPYCRRCMLTKISVDLRRRVMWLDGSKKWRLHRPPFFFRSTFAREKSFLSFCCWTIYTI